LPELTITVTVAQWQRIKSALGFANAAQAERWVKAKVRRAVQVQERATAAKTAEDALGQDGDDWE
jgi:hypothetical protein|tara:strand:- start:1617 stop:1811 length:195 start_codon:yes stop_codon:yes gene_type:complete